MPDVFKPTLASRLRQLAALRGWSQQQCASALGISRQTWARYCDDNESSEPGREELMRIRDVFEVSLDWLLRPPGAVRVWVIDRATYDAALATRDPNSPAWDRHWGMLLDERSKIVTDEERVRLEQRFNAAYDALQQKRRR